MSPPEPAAPPGPPAPPDPVAPPVDPEPPPEPVLVLDVVALLLEPDEPTVVLDPAAPPAFMDGVVGVSSHPTPRHPLISSTPRTPNRSCTSRISSILSKEKVQPTF
jgi:hypothetical protein